MLYRADDASAGTGGMGFPGLEPAGGVLPEVASHSFSQTGASRWLKMRLPGCRARSSAFILLRSVVFESVTTEFRPALIHGRFKPPRNKRKIHCAFAKKRRDNTPHIQTIGA